MVLTDILNASAARYGSRPALTMRMGYRTISLSYHETKDLAIKVAVFLRNLGIQRGEAVLILAPNSPYWAAVFWGCLIGGYVPVPLNVQSTEQILRTIVEHTNAKALFKFFHFRQEIPKRIAAFDIDFLPELVGDMRSEGFSPYAPSENDTAQIMYTSGTTGEPKGVIHTHRNIVSNLAALRKLIPFRAGDVFLSILPLSHVFEQTAGFLFPFSQGIEIVYAHSPSLIRELLFEHRITHLVAVPEFLRIVISKIESAAEEKGRIKLLNAMMRLASGLKTNAFRRIIFRSIHASWGGRLRVVASGGSALDPALERKWGALGIQLFQGYGLTETSPIVAMNSYAYRREGSVGKVIPGVHVRLGADGEVIVKGPNVFKGYYNDEKKTHEVLEVDGSFHTGDIGELDADGFLYLRGRKKYLIKGPGAQNVYPEDIERELNAFPHVRDSCVVGVERNGGLVDIHAVLLPDQDAKPADGPLVFDDAWAHAIVDAANGRLASFQHVNSCSVWEGDDFPRSATRKVQKEEILKWVRAKQGSASPGAESLRLRTTPLVRLIAEVTAHNRANITPATKVVPELNIDSLLRIELVARIEEKFNAAVDEAQIGPETTVSDIEALIEKRELPQKGISLASWPRSWWARWERIGDQILIIFPLIRLFWIRLRIEGRENLRDIHFPVIFMPNHLSILDAPSVAMALPLRIRKRIAFAAASDVFYGTYRKISFLFELFLNTFPFPRREGDHIKGGLDSMGRLLDDNWSVVVFPEGRMSRTGDLEPLKRGAGLIAVEMGVPVVPVKIIGTDKLARYDRIFPRKHGLVTVRFGKPLYFKRSDSHIEVTRALEQAIRRL